MSSGPLTVSAFIQNVSHMYCGQKLSERIYWTGVYDRRKHLFENMWPLPEGQLEKANVNVLYQKSLQENPQFASNPLSRWQQKQAIKRQYAAAKHAGQTAGNTAQAASKTGKAARTVKEKAQQAGAFVMRHKKGFLMAGVLFLITCMLMNTMSSCSMMAQSIGSVLSGTTYPSDDPEMLAVEADYAAREAQLQEEIDNIESSHPGYDEYRYDLGMIGHDPHELAAFLSAVLQGYTRQSAQAELARVFAAQYQLTLTEEVEIRYRMETSTDPETGETTSEDTLKISTNTPLAEKKSGWIDFNTGVIADGEKTIDEAAKDLLDLVIRVAGGEQTKAEKHGFREISIFKDGVVL